jgi:hypothetical protein
MRQVETEHMQLHPYAADGANAFAEVDLRMARRMGQRHDRLARSTRDLLNTLAAITGKDYAEEALSVVHSLNFRSALGIFF